MRFHLSLYKVLLSFLLLSAGLLLVQMAVSGEQTEPKIILLRLEDVGPGGEYGSLDQLGKLRAVLEFLGDQDVRYQIGVIPKWVNYSEEGLSYSRSLDQTGDTYMRALTGILQNAERSGAVIGMHGYTHQTGEKKRPDGHQESGIGNEFHVDDAPETETLPFAEARVKEGLKLFQAAGLKPAFWETPHYHSAAEQHRVFRSYFGILYEYKPETPRQTALYVNPELNQGFGSPSWGAAYVPTPYSYIPYNRDEKLILDQLGKSDRLPSFFYHAFLEFKYLTPVLDEDGEPLLRDGIPEYRYPEKARTILQKLIVSARERGYRFYSLNDYVPFTPSNRVDNAGGNKGHQLEDVTGDGQLDKVVWDAATGKVRVFPGQYRDTTRNVQQPPEEIWGTIPRRHGDLFGLKDEDGDGKADLWIVRASGKAELYRSRGSSFTFVRAWQLPSPQNWEELHILSQGNKGVVLAGLADGGTLLQAYVKLSGKWVAVQESRGRPAALRSMQTIRNAATGADELVYCRNSTGICSRLEIPAGDSKWKITKQSLRLPDTGGSLKLGDFNGDGREDALAWNEESRTATVFRQQADGSYGKLSSFGPWGEEGALPFLADFDGNGETDLAALEPGGALDVALSYQRAD